MPDDHPSYDGPPYDEALEGGLDRFFAGEMSGDERGDFEHRFADAIAGERAVRGALAAAFAPPPPMTLPSTSSPADLGAAAGRRTLWRSPAAWLVALLVVASLAGAWRLNAWRSERVLEGRTTEISIHRDAVDRGFVPTVADADAARLSIEVSSKLGLSVTVTADEPRVAWLGFSSAPGGTPLRLQVFARVDGAPVSLFIDRSASAGGRAVVMGPGANVFRSVVGELQLVEVTPLDREVVTPLVRVR